MIRYKKKKISKKTEHSDNNFEILYIVYRSYKWLINLSKDLLNDIISFKKNLKLNKKKL